MRQLAVLAVVLFASDATSQEFTLAVDVPAVSFDVSVVDRRGIPVAGLRESDFEVWEDGVLQPTLYFGDNTEPNPYYISLLFDSSGSTANRWNLMEEAVQAFVDATVSDARLLSGFFGSFLHLPGDWESPEQIGVGSALVPAEVRMESGRSTQFYRSVGEALSRVFEGIDERRVLVLMTDGRDSSLYRETLRRGRVPDRRNDFWYSSLLDTLRTAGVPVYIIALNTDFNAGVNQMGTDEYLELRRLFPNSTLPDDYLRQVRLRLEEIARVTGGKVLFPESIEEVDAFAVDITRGLGAGYSIGYSPAPAQPDEGVRRIAVRVTGRDQLRVRHSQTEYDPR